MDATRREILMPVLSEDAEEGRPRHLVRGARRPVTPAARRLARDLAVDLGRLA